MFNIFKREKKGYNYFTSFEEVSLLIVEAAKFLSTNLKEYELSTLGEKVKEFHKIERAADEKKKEMMRYLYKDFLPPIEREDIIEMAYALDTVLNDIEDILIQIDMYQIETIPSDMIAFLEVIEKSADKLSNIMKKLSNFKNPEKLLLATEKIINLEEEGDIIYYQAIKNLHVGKVDIFKSYRYSKIYDVFETSVDSFEDLANVVEAIILKNT